MVGVRAFFRRHLFGGHGAPAGAAWNYSDDFNAGGGNFTKFFGNFDATFAAGKVTGYDEQAYWYNTDALSDDMDVSIRPILADDEGHGVGAMARCDGLNAYMGVVFDDGQGDPPDYFDTYEIYKCQAEIVNVMIAQVRPQHNNNLAVKLRVLGNTLTLYQNGVQMAGGVDSSIAAGRKAGFYLWDDGYGGAPEADDWTCANIPACPELAPVEFGEETALVWLPLELRTGRSTPVLAPVNPLGLRLWYDDSIIDPLTQMHACYIVRAADAAKFAEAVPEMAVDPLTVAKWELVRKLRRNAYLVKAGAVHPAQATKWHSREHTWRSHELANGDKVYYRDGPYTTPSILEIESDPAGACAGPDESVEKLLAPVSATTADEKAAAAELIATALRYNVSAQAALSVAQMKGCQDIIGPEIELIQQ